MEEILPHIFHVRIPLMNSPLKELNCFMLRGEGRHLVIDTGFNQPEARAALLGALAELGFAPEKTDIFITHLHSDHSGLVCALKNEHNRAFCGEVDAKICNSLLTEEYWQDIDRRNLFMGFNPKDMLTHLKHPAYSFRLDHPINFTRVREGDVLAVGPYRLEVIDLAGHTPGQMGLYDEGQQILFCADHILAKISPNIIAWDLQHDYLGIFLKNLVKVRAMQVRHLLGGHRTFVADHRLRIDELLFHHQKRLDEALAALASGPKNVLQTAGRLSWDFAGGDFEAFPPQQQWFAASEAFAHLQHLFFKGKIRRSEDKGVLLYHSLP